MTLELSKLLYTSLSWPWSVLSEERSGVPGGCCQSYSIKISKIESTFQQVLTSQETCSLGTVCVLKQTNSPTKPVITGTTSSAFVEKQSVVFPPASSVTWSQSPWGLIGAQKCAQGILSFRTWTTNTAAGTSLLDFLCVSTLTALFVRPRISNCTLHRLYTLPHEGAMNTF